MFESLRETGVRSVGKRILAMMLSVAAHVLMILLLVVLPLVCFHILPQAELLTLLIAAPAPPPTLAPPVPQPLERQSEVVRKTQIDGASWTPPTILPHGIPAPDEEPPMVGVIPGFNGVDSGILVGSRLAGNGPAGSLVGLTPAAPPPPPPPAPKHALVVRGGDVQAAKLIRKVVPIYPPLALRARVEGTVILEINVDEEGNVTEVRVLQGNPLLEDEAVRAVKQWKYSPTLLNGEPIPILSTVKVEFRLKRFSY